MIWACYEGTTLFQSLLHRAKECKLNSDSEGGVERTALVDAGWTKCADPPGLLVASDSVSGWITSTFRTKNHIVPSESEPAVQLSGTACSLGACYYV